MQYAEYCTYKELKGIDKSFNESIFNIKLIFSKYNKEIILSFLSYITRELGFINALESIKALQIKLGIHSNKNLIHTRAILVLSQIFFETNNYSDNSDNLIITEDIINLFLYANQILTKTDNPSKKLISNKIIIGNLMTAMRLYIGAIPPLEIKLIVEIFIKFYEKMSKTNKFDDFNKIIYEEYGLEIKSFINILNIMSSNKFPNEIFRFYERFVAVDYDIIFDKWKNRNPKIKIPNDYRFFEEYPLIKKQNKLYSFSLIMLFMSIARKIYHILSANVESKDCFRAYWGKEIIETVIKEYFKNIFVSGNIHFVDVDFQKETGIELADLVFIDNDNIYLIEIKSGYMALEHRYSDDESVFKENFDKKYLYNSSNRHQMVNQLEIFERDYTTFQNLCNLNRNVKYKVFSCLMVFDEALKMMGFKRYINDEYNKFLNYTSDRFSKIEPCPNAILMTFGELLYFRNINDISKRMTIFHKSFYYPDSLTDLFEDIKDNQIKIDGISSDDII